MASLHVEKIALSHVILDAQVGIGHFALYNDIPSCTKDTTAVK